MKLKLSPIQLDAGRPVAFIDEKKAAILNVHVGDRVEILHNKGKVIAVADVVRNFMNPEEISLSREILQYLNIKKGEIVEVSIASPPSSAQFISKKVMGKTLTREEIYSIIRDIVTNSLTEAETAYFVSGVYSNGMNMKETVYLTEAIYKTGESIQWHSSEVADKHCIGGIPGNRTTPIVVSICASAGVIMPKTSSRAITSAAGTADVIETIARVDFSSSNLKEIVKNTGACLAWGGSLGLAPADDKLIRVERLLNVDPESQLIASIMAKKLAVGSRNILIDIPFGPGAKVTESEARELKRKFILVARHFNLNMKVILTKGDQPIGNGIGPVLEMIDVIKVLKRDNPPQDLEKKSIHLAGEILEMMGKSGKGKGKTLAKETLESGKAFEKFKEIISAQGGKIPQLKPAEFKVEIKSPSNGEIKSIDNKLINSTSRLLGCPADKLSGIYLLKHKRDEVKKGETIAILYSESKKKLLEAYDFSKKHSAILVK